MLLLACGLCAQVPLFRAQQGEAIAQIKAKVLYQDAKGWFWMGSQRGVYRYDGLDCDPFMLPDTIGGAPHASAIFQQGDTLWAGFSDGHIGYLSHRQRYPAQLIRFGGARAGEGGRLALWQPEEGTPQKTITGFATDRNGYLWIATYGEGIYVWNGRRLFQFNHDDDNLCSDEIYTICCDNDGQIWVATDNGISVVTFSPKEQKNVRNLGRNEGLSDEIVTVLTKDAQGNIWIGTHDNGLCRYEAATRTLRPFSDAPWPYGEVMGIAVYEGHEAWVSTAAGLVQCTTWGICQQVAAPAKVTQLLRDREGLLWLLGEQGGLFSANLSATVLPTTFRGGLQTVCCAPDGRIWVGTQEGLYVRNGLDWVATGHRANVISLLTLPNGQVWAGTFGNGICVYDGSTGRVVRCLDLAQGLPNGSILSMTAAQGRIWVATLGGVVGIDPKTWQVQSLGQVSGQPDAAQYYAYKLFTDSRDRLWCCTDGHGLALWDGQQFQNWQAANGQSFRTIYAIAEDQQGHIWFSGEQTYLWRYDGAAFRQITPAREHLHGPNITSLAITGNGHLVVGYPDGIDLVTPASEHIVFLSGSTGTELAEASLNAACTDPLGHVWLGLANGLGRVAGFAQNYAIDPLTQIKAVANLGSPIDPKHTTTFAYNENHLIFEYVGIWLTNPGAVYYRYKLEGFDPDWTISKDRIASYPNLPPGDYCFRVQSSEHGRFDNTREDFYAFTIRKPFWAEWWFLCICIALLGTLANWYIGQRESRLRREQDMKNEKIAAQLDVLKTQISPHFLFNSFNTLITIIEENPKVAVDYVEHLADFYRSIMVYREKDFIPLAEELDIVRNFGYLLKRRYEDALQIRVEAPNPTIGQVMPLTLQLLLENAVKHNVISKTQPLQIDIFVENGDTIVVRNNKNLKIKPEPGTRFGLQSLSQRYEVLTGRQLVVRQGNGVFEVRVPLVV